ncbi:MAG: MBL fold metallo-hydrolase [Pseudomonadales bacterium]|nr:MBL fold metallo-hydrolase [Pseudomonadales bacterium]
MKLYIVEGNTQKLDGGAMFGNAPKALWSRWVEADTLNRIDLACRCLLVQMHDGRKILLEAGVGSFFSPAMQQRFGVTESSHCLLNNLATLGFDHGDIDDVILSHAHFDHVGGLFSSYVEGEEPCLLFPNARIWLGEKQWIHAQNPHSRDKASYIAPLISALKKSSRLHLLGDDGRVLSDVDKPLPAAFSFHFSDGHTPGLMLTEIATGQGPLVFVSDMIPGQHWVHLPICMGYDRCPELLIDEKKALLGRLLGCDGRLFFTHDAKMPCGMLQKDSRDRFYVKRDDALFSN